MLEEISPPPVASLAAIKASRSVTKKVLMTLFQVSLTIGFILLLSVILKLQWVDLDTSFQKFLFSLFFLAGPPHLLIFWGSQLIMYFIYIKKIPFLEQYRTNEKSWPWEKDSKKWRVELKKAVKATCVNHFIVIPIMVIIDYLTGIESRFDEASWPSFYEIITQLIIFMVFEDTCYYWAHRLMHWKKAYKHVHKVHHEYNVTVSIAMEYTHPAEFLFADLLPAKIGCKLLGGRNHFATFMIWGTIRIFGALDSHCGYEFPWSPYGMPYFRSSKFHNLHHANVEGNYGSVLPLWDYICGTTINEKQKVKLTSKEN